MSYEFSDILKLLPHRHPFLFVDKIVSVELGEEHTCAKKRLY
jgi:3-hydroxymyristoyl/3-hydroxydecanoyl-(acyl carrier protein) dehydratase